MESHTKNAQLTKGKAEKENKRNRKQMGQIENKTIDFKPIISITTKCE